MASPSRSCNSPACTMLRNWLRLVSTCAHLVCLRACVHACAHVCACEGIGAPALGYRAQCSTLRTYLQYVHVCIYACMHVCIKHMYGVCAYIRICINTYMLRARDLRAEPAYMNTWTDACLYRYMHACIPAQPLRLMPHTDPLSDSDSCRIQTRSVTQTHARFALSCYQTRTNTHTRMKT